MNATLIKKLLVPVCILIISVSLMSCSSDDDKSVDGLIYNSSAYRATVNFLNIKIVEASAGALLPEGSLDKETTYLLQVTIFANDGSVLHVEDNTLIIDSSTDEHNINGQTCSWFIRISGEQGDFKVTSAS